MDSDRQCANFSDWLIDSNRQCVCANFVRSLRFEFSQTPQRVHVYFSVEFARAPGRNSACGQEACIAVETLYTNCPGPARTADKASILLTDGYSPLCRQRTLSVHTKTILWSRHSGPFRDRLTRFVAYLPSLLPSLPPSLPTPPPNPRVVCHKGRLGFRGQVVRTESRLFQEIRSSVGAINVSGTRGC